MVVVSLPDIALVTLMAMCVAVTAAITLQMFTPWLVSVLFLVVLVSLSRCVPLAPAKGHQLAGATGAVIVAIAWVILNVPYTAEHLWITRDPGIYTIMGLWLTDHESLGIGVQKSLELQHQVPGLSVILEPYGPPDAAGFVDGQGGVTLAGLAGVAGWIGGVDGVLSINLVVGAIALLGVYSLGRRVVRPSLALAAQIAMALSVSYIYLMRAPYSEGIALAAGLAAVVWLIHAFTESRATFAIAAGVFVGAVSMARLDGPVMLVGSAFAVVGIAIVARASNVRGVLRVAVAFLVSAVVASLGGVLSIRIVHARYVENHYDQVMPLWTTAVISVLFAAVVLAIRALQTRSTRPRHTVQARGRELPDRALGRLGMVCGALIPALFVVLWSRPAWWQGHYVPEDNPAFLGVEKWQEAEGLTVDGTRSYEEMTLHWVGWYFGWATVVLAAIGLGILLARGVTRRNYAALIIVVPVAVTGALYFNKLSVAPDQVWAYRRLLPVITPGMLIGAMVVVETWLRRTKPQSMTYGAAAIATLLVVTGPVVAWNDLLRVREGEGVRSFTADFCDRLGSGSEPVLLAAGRIPSKFAMTVKVACGRDVVTGPATDRAYLRELDATVGEAVVVAFDVNDLPRGTHLSEPTGEGRFRYWGHRLGGIPDTTTEVVTSYWVGHIGPHGGFRQNRE